MAGIGHKAAKAPLDVLHAAEWNDDHEVDGDVDFQKHEIQNAVMHKSASAPASPVEGQYYYNTTQKKAYYYNGSDWVELCPTITGADQSVTLSPTIAYDINPARDQEMAMTPTVIVATSVA